MQLKDLPPRQPIGNECVCQYPHVIVGVDYCQKCGRINRQLPKRQSSEEEIERLKEENKKLKFMIDKGLGWEDMRNDITYPHEL